MTAAELSASALSGEKLPEGLSAGAQALWLLKKGEWEPSHEIAQEMHTSMGSWIHALLHLVEGDVGNANYWFHKAGRPTRRVSEIDDLWNTIATEVLAHE